MAIVLAILLPVFGLIAGGYAMARTRLLSSEGVRGLGTFVYYVALPALLFRSTALPSPSEGGHGAVIVAFFGGALVLFALGMLIGRYRFRMGLPEQGVLAINVSFGNTVQMGVPLVLAASVPAAWRQ